MLIHVRPLSQLAMMAAIVATLLCVPLAVLLALAGYLALDVSIRSFVTFGERVYPVFGLLLWWAACYLVALAYSAFMMPEQ